MKIIETQQIPIAQVRPEVKFCPACIEYKEFSEFGTYNATSRGKTRLQGYCSECHRKKSLEWNKKNPERHKVNVTKSSKKLTVEAKIKVIEYYSGGTGKCACCPEKYIEFLTIDHINGNGNQHRREIKAAGQYLKFYGWLIRNNFPEGYRVLCMNCNFARGKYGYCPHERNEGV